MKPKHPINKQDTVIALSYRDEANGKGAFFDHFTLRALTNCMTNIVHPPGTNTTQLANLINYRAGHGSYGLPLDTNLPKTADNDAENAAFLFIPGYTRDSDDSQSPSHKARIEYEKKLINKAITRGQPVLAVCAGSWTLWGAYGGKITAATDHNYGGAMPRLSTSGPAVCNNKMIHRVKVNPHTFMASAMGFKKTVTESPLVNSVHWNAPDNDPLKKPKHLEVTATSVKDDAIAPLSRQQHIMQPNDGVEAFETKFGVPMLGIQWHPEAFNPGENLKQEAIFKFMKTAGETYIRRRELNQEFKKTALLKIEWVDTIH